MKSILIFAALFLIVGFTPVSKDRKTAHLDKEFTLKIGQSAYLKKEDLTITLESVGDDSRCPRGVSCVWAGNATVVLKVRRSEREPISLNLNTNLEPKVTKYSFYEIGFAGLSPYPSSDSPISKRDYEASVVVRKTN